MPPVFTWVYNNPSKISKKVKIVAFRNWIIEIEKLKSTLNLDEIQHSSIKYNKTVLISPNV